MIGQRINQLRLAKGLSLEELSKRMDGFVTKQALSKYELGKDRPSATVIVKLASALSVKSSYLLSEPEITIQFVAFRKKSKLGKKEADQLKNQISLELETRVKLQEKLGELSPVQISKQTVDSMDDVEQEALKLRKRWKLGLDPIDNLTAVLENQRFHVIEIDKSYESFDGLSAVASNMDNKPVAYAVVSKSGLPGDRQRFNLAHELGHILLEPGSSFHKESDMEKAAHRFAAAFLAPAETVYQQVGKKRNHISLDELKLYKSFFKMSMQSLLYRFKDLDIISQIQFVSWFKLINQQGWKKEEPVEIDSERPQWKQTAALRAYNEGFIGVDEAQTMVGDQIKIEIPEGLKRLQDVMKLPIEERRKLLAKQAEIMVSHHDDVIEDDFIGDLVEE